MSRGDNWYDSTFDILGEMFVILYPQFLPIMIVLLLAVCRPFTHKH